MADTHTLQEIIEKTIQTTLLKAHPVGSYWLTESDDDPNALFGGGWERVKGKLLQCSDDTHPAGTDIEAGLPNITGGGNAGSICAYVWAATSTSRNNTWKGALGIISAANGENFSPTSWNEPLDARRPYGLAFNASLSNAIYGKSDTVQPETHVVNVWKRIS